MTFYAIIILIIIILITQFFLNKPRFNLHIFNKQKAKLVYKKLNKISNENKGWLISYLRKIDPFVFEELILYTFSKSGFTPIRNKRYTGDGGIDGKVKRDGEIFFIQAKRYSDFIKLEHIKDFIHLCNLNNTRGFFIHTGKTGNQSREVIKNCDNVKIISGESLYRFFIETESKENIFFL